MIGFSLKSAMSFRISSVKAPDTAATPTVTSYSIELLKFNHLIFGNTLWFHLRSRTYLKGTPCKLHDSWQCGEQVDLV